MQLFDKLMLIYSRKDFIREGTLDGLHGSFPHTQKNFASARLFCFAGIRKLILTKTKTLEPRRREGREEILKALHVEEL
ncbi:MAG: hypothetical protein A2X58_06450 [Nitrospirae bacterium GWC2_56_14]|nr:MAG: hypothetical protein A2X58_06450 [Nitrospirae bacterium GWC2_56_14]